MSKLAKKNFLLNVLKILNKIDFNLGLGICYQINDADLENALYEYWLYWPKHSGKKVFPVPHSTLNPKLAFMAADDYWDKETEYGRNRHELLQWTKDQIQHELDNL
jgi:hypothetical protein